jgi:VWFA-related protein
VVRLLPPAVQGQRVLTGKTVVEALTLDERVEKVELYLDDVLVARKTFPPFEARIELDAPPREQRVKAVALDGRDQPLGEDVLVVNRFDPPFRVRIVEITRGGADSRSSGVTVRAEVSVPRRARLDHVLFYRNDEMVAEAEAAPFLATMDGAGTSGRDFVRVVAKLADGRELEDVELLAPGAMSEEVEVQLAQLQVLVTDRQGAPAAGLGDADFEVVDGGQARTIDRLEPAPNVALLLGLAVDSSGSMGPLWPETRLAAQRFLDGVLGARDRAFLVDFDSSLRLLQEPTGDRADLERALDRLEPYGGTALYDSMLFSMLQFDREPGRRALVVITDGFDSHSRADPARAIELGQRLGIPVYVIAMDVRDAGGLGAPPVLGGAGRGRGGVTDAASARMNLRLVTEPTGGRLYQVGSVAQVERAFAQIEQELRQQYVLTFYTDRAPDAVPDTKVTVLRKDLRVRSALPLETSGAP